MKVSFVIPVYNTEKYIDACLSSITNQGLKEEDYEIIVVNDGSTDSSLDHCMAFARQHSNVVVISQKNSGVGMARNAGVAASHGDWICFVDSDDYLSSGGIKAVLTLVKDESCKLVRFWSRIVSESYHENSICNGAINFVGCAHDFIKKFGMDVFCYNYLYDRLWLFDSGIVFEKYRIAEDYLFVSKLLLLNPPMVSTTIRSYNYVKHPNSITGLRSPDHTASVARSYLGVIDNLFDYYDNLQSNDSEIDKLVLVSAQLKVRSFLSRVLSSNISASEFSNMIVSLRKLRVLPLGPPANWRQKISFWGFNFMCNHPFFLSIERIIHKRIIIPLILPIINKNRNA